MIFLRRCYKTFFILDLRHSDEISWSVCCSQVFTLKSKICEKVCTTYGLEAPHKGKNLYLSRTNAPAYFRRRKRFYRNNNLWECNKTFFYSVTDPASKEAMVFIPSRPYQPDLIYVGKARSQH